jgi:hypothetical protein
VVETLESCRGLARREAVGESWRSEPCDECGRGQSDVNTTFVSAAHVKKDYCKGSDWFMVHITAVKSDVQNGMSTKNDKDKLNNEWQALIEEYEDFFRRSTLVCLLDGMWSWRLS